MHGMRKKCRFKLCTLGVLHESYAHFRYRWLNYFLRMRSTSGI